MVEADWDRLNTPTGREEFDSPNRFDLDSVSQVTQLARRVRSQSSPPAPAAPQPVPAAQPAAQPAVQPRHARQPTPSSHTGPRPSQPSPSQQATSGPPTAPPPAPQPPPPSPPPARPQPSASPQTPPQAAPPQAPLQTAPRQPRPAWGWGEAAPASDTGHLPPEQDRHSSVAERTDGTTPDAPPPQFTHRSLVRPYARTGGRTRPAKDLALEALVATTVRGQYYEGVESPEQRFVCDLCVEVHSIAEIAAFAKLPLGVVKIVVDDLAEAGAVEIQQPGFVLADRDSRDFMERILTGLRAL